MPATRKMENAVVMAILAGHDFEPSRMTDRSGITGRKPDSRSAKLIQIGRFVFRVPVQSKFMGPNVIAKYDKNIWPLCCNGWDGETQAQDDRGDSSHDITRAVCC